MKETPCLKHTNSLSVLRINTKTLPMLFSRSLITYLHLLKMLITQSCPALCDLFLSPTYISSLPSLSVYFGILFQFSSVAHLCPTFCDPMNRSMPGLPVHHKLMEFTQTHAHRVGDATQPSHPLSSPFFPCPQSLPASGSFPTSQLFARGGQSIGVSASASVLPMNT